jgi:hypothetical protein
MKTINVVVRRVKKTGMLELFFANDYGPKAKGGNAYWWIECFNRSEGHSEASRSYMLRQTTPVPTDDPEALALAKYWESICPDRYDVRIVSTLRGPRGYMYGGE